MEQEQIIRILIIVIGCLAGLLLLVRIGFKIWKHFSYKKYAEQKIREFGEKEKDNIQDDSK